MKFYLLFAILTITCGCSASQKTVKDIWAEPEPSQKELNEGIYESRWICGNIHNFKRPINAYLSGEWNDYDSRDTENYLKKALTKRSFSKDTTFHLKKLINRSGGVINNRSLPKKMVTDLVNRGFSAKILKRGDKVTPDSSNILISGEINLKKREIHKKRIIWNYTISVQLQSDKTEMIKPFKIIHECRLKQMKVEEKPEDPVKSVETEDF